MRSFVPESTSPGNAIFTSIIVMLFCCQPLGVASLVFSVLAHVEERSGNFPKSRVYLAYADGLNAGALLFFILGMLIFVPIMCV